MYKIELEIAWLYVITIHKHIILLANFILRSKSLLNGIFNVLKIFSLSSRQKPVRHKHPFFQELMGGNLYLKFPRFQMFGKFVNKLFKLFDNYFQEN